MAIVPSARVRSSSVSPCTAAYLRAHRANSWPGDISPYGQANDRLSCSGTTMSPSAVLPSAGPAPCAACPPPWPPGPRPSARPNRPPVDCDSARYTTTTDARPALTAAAACITTAPSASPPCGAWAKKDSSGMPRPRTSMASLTGSNGAVNRHIPSTSATSTPASAHAASTASIARSQALPGSALPYRVWPIPTIAAARLIKACPAAGPVLRASPVRARPRRASPAARPRCAGPAAAAPPPAPGSGTSAPGSRGWSPRRGPGRPR